MVANGSMWWSVLCSLCCWLPSMRWLLCGDDGSKKTKTKSVISKKCPAREFIPIAVLINSKNFKAALNYEFYSFN